MLYFGNSPVCVLTCGDLVKLMEHHDIEPLNISKEEIQDKSKNSMFMKFIATSKVAWFVIKTIIRLLNHLPITHLELGVICLCFVDFVIFFCWFKKPLDVEVPTPVRLVKKERPGKRIPGGSTGSTTGSVRGGGSLDAPAATGSQAASGSVHDGAQSLEGTSDGGDTVVGTESVWASKLESILREFREALSRGGVDDTHTAAIDNVIKSLGYSAAVTSLLDEEKHPVSKHGVWFWNGITEDWNNRQEGWVGVVRLFMAPVCRLWMALFRPVIKLIDDGEKRSGRHQVPMFSAAIFGKRLPEIVHMQIYVSFPVALISGAIFSGGHLFAWSWHFPTAAERFLWQAAGIVSAVVPLLTGVVFFFSEVLKRKKDKGPLLKLCEMLVNWLGLNLVKYPFPPAYFIGRVLLVVLMFTTLRNLPSTAYQV